MKNYATIVGLIITLIMCSLASSIQAQADKLQTATPLKELTIDLGSGVTMEFVFIPVGSFMMGSSKREKPLHKVIISKPFYVGKYEVTQEQWQTVTGDNPSCFKGAKNPVENVSWEDCQIFIAKLSEKTPGRQFSLPTSAQWEYACRAGSTNDYCYGDGEGKLGDYAWYSKNANKTTHPVGEKNPNAWGLYDMHGNVWEWCQDRDQDSPTLFRVIRSGSWGDDAFDLRSADLGWNAPGIGRNYCGLRLVMAVETP